MKNILIVFFIIIFANCLFAQKSVDVIYFKSGNIVKGKIKEINFDNIKMRTTHGNLYIFNSESILKIGREEVRKEYKVPIPKFFTFASGGYTIPISDSDNPEVLNPGVGVNFGLGYRLDDLITLKLDVQYNNLPFKVEKVDPEISIGAVKYTEKSSSKSFSTLKLELMLHNPVNLINPYGLIGAGLYFLEKGGKYNHRTNFGFSIGGGFSLRLLQNYIYLFAETQCNYNFTTESEKSYIPIKVGLMLFPLVNP